MARCSVGAKVLRQRLTPPSPLKSYPWPTSSLPWAARSWPRRRSQRALRELTVSADRKTTIMRLTIAGDFDEALEIVDITGDDFKTGMIEGIEEIKGLMQGLEDK